MPTTQETLKAVETAIHNLMTGGAVQSYSIGGRNIAKFSLTELRALKAELKQELANKKRGGSRNYAAFEGES